MRIFDIEAPMDPYDALKRLRDEAPAFHVPGMNVHRVNRYDLVREVIKDT
jgi:hypothetical protein